MISIKHVFIHVNEEMKSRAKSRSYEILRLILFARVPKVPNMPFVTSV